MKERLRIAATETILVKNTTTTVTVTSYFCFSCYYYKKQHAIHNKNIFHNGKMILKADTISSPNSGPIVIDQGARSYMEVQLYSQFLE